MIKSHYSIGHKLVIFVKGNELESPQVKNSVEDLALGQYKGAYPEIIVIGETTAQWLLLDDKTIQKNQVYILTMS
ncbi:hypothetical protein [Bacillus mojavensis]|uniref:hypothetical protein n=1 Tax=Bacillus mojavensis TaxID=72360 RepID=UPI00145556BA|nr:hypothetical protein [Bacillus mojavensis]